MERVAFCQMLKASLKEKYGKVNKDLKHAQTHVKMKQLLSTVDALTQQ